MENKKPDQKKKKTGNKPEPKEDLGSTYTTELAKRRKQQETISKILEENSKVQLPMNDNIKYSLAKAISLGSPIKTGIAGAKEILKEGFQEDPQNLIEIFPNDVIFKDIQTAQTYEINIVVRNLAKTSKRIRVYQPKTSKFRCDYLMLGGIGPGLAIQLVVSFETNVLGDFHDVLKVVSEDNLEREISLHAYAPQASIIFDPMVDMGFVQVGREKSEVINFKNEGSMPGEVSLNFSSLTDFRIEPSPKFRIGPGELYSVRLIYSPKEAGIFRGLIDVNTEGHTFLKHIDVNATSTDFAKFIIDEDGMDLNSISFGNIFFGSSSYKKAYLINNSPKKISFRVSFIQGLHTNVEDYANLVTPYEEGLEQTERVMVVEPQSGSLDSYSQIPLKFICKSQIEEDCRIWSRNFAIAGKEITPLEKNHEYTAIFEFDNKDERKSIGLTAHSICPKVRLGKTIVEFGECAQNDRRDMTIELSNMHDDMELKVDCPNVSHFFATPKSIYLTKGLVTQVNVTFRPKNLGKFTQVLSFMINGSYDIPVKFMGVCHLLEEKTKASIKEKSLTKKRGPLALPSDFEEVRKPVGSITTVIRKRKTNTMDKMIMSTTDPKMLSELFSATENIGEAVEEWKRNKENKKKFNDYLKNERIGRKKEKEQRAIAEIVKETEERINQNFGMSYKGTEDDLEERPVNYEYLFKNETAGMVPPKCEIPKKVDSLFVTRPIGQYEPFSAGIYNQSQAAEMGTLHQVFSGVPKSHSELRDTTMELTGEMLQKITVGPVSIDFKEVYIHSKVSKFFQVKNDLRTAIRVRVESDHEELEESALGYQIIPSGKCGGFKIVFACHNRKPPYSFNHLLKYSINDKHFFKIQVKAEVVPVCLRFVGDINSLRLAFIDESLDMEATEVLRIENPGNDYGTFEWQPSETKCFSVEPMSGVVPPNGGRVECKVSYIPRSTGPKPGGDEELLRMNVEWGEQQTLRVTGAVNETKCELKPTAFDFGEKPVSHKYTEKLEIKNKNPKNFAVFKVIKVPPGVEVNPKRDRIGPERSKELDVSFLSKEVKDIENETIEISVRGAGIYKIPFSVKTIIPSVKILQEKFDFDSVTFGNTASLPMTIVNESLIPCTLILNLNEDAEEESEKQGFACLQIEDANPEDPEVKVLEERDENEESVVKGEHLDGSMNNESSDDEDLGEDEKKEKMEGSAKVYYIHLEPEKQYEFRLKFTPFEAQMYAFHLPIELKNFERIDSLTRKVTCTGLPPKFMMDTQNGVVEFPKKIITNNEIAMPEYKLVDFSNPDIRKPLKWRIGVDELEEQKVFTIIPSDGKIDPQQTIQLKIGFKPLLPGNYSQKVPIFLDDDNKKPYFFITLKGEGDNPKLLFDRKEVILPIVPLETEATSTFNIYNEGYQSLNVVGVIAEENFVGKVPFKLVYPDGKTLGVNSKSIRVQVVMKSDKPVSFTTKVSFKDDKEQSYPIFVSGTADNCILTNYPFFQRCGEDFEITAEKGQPIGLVSVEEKSLDDDMNDGAATFSKAGSQASRAGKSSLGYTQIPAGALNLSCEHAKKWMNHNLLSIEKEMRQFPHDLIAESGGQMFDLVEMLTKKSAPGRVKLEPSLKKPERAQKLHGQYSALILFLKQQGALLNTIRPEFLLSLQEYQSFVKTHPKDFEHIHPRFLKISEPKFNYLSADAWLVLFYQILKLFFLSRINVRNLLQMVGDKATIPEYYKAKSTVYTFSEVLLFRWMEHCYETVNSPHEKRLKNFDLDLRDGTVISAMIHFYASKLSKVNMAIKKAPSSEEDIKFNCEKLRDHLLDLGLLSYMEAKDLYAPSGREFLLYLLFLFQMLPHYKPREKIIFSCMLDQTVTRTITLTNPLSKPISYYVSLNAYKDFKAVETDNLIKLDPRAQREFKVSYTARLSHTQEGIIMFRSRKEGSTNAAPLVFELASQVTGRESRDKKLVSDVLLYESKAVDIEVRNPFESEVDFFISLENVSIKAAEAIIKKKPVKPTRGNKGNLPAVEENQTAKRDPNLPDDYPPAFFMKTDRIKIKKLGVARITVYYMPMTYENHKCFIIFRDERVGEMQYEVVGTPLPPAPIRIPPCSIYIESPDPIDVPIPILNTNLHNGLMRVYEKLRETRRENMKPVFSSFFAPQEAIPFEVELDPSNFASTNHRFTLYTSSGTQSSKNLEKGKKGHHESVPSAGYELGSNSQTGSTGTMENVIPKNIIHLTPQFKSPIPNFKLIIGLKSENKADVRIFEVLITILPKVIRANLEMKTHAGTPIRQEIPIVNPLENKDSSVKVILDRERLKHPEAWEIPTETIKLQKKQPMRYLTVTFKPDWILTGDECAEAKITLQNTLTNDTYEYELKGFAEEPYPEKHLVIECKARQASDAIIPLPQNTTGNTITYRIETDLIGVQGLSEKNNTKNVAPGEAGNIKFQIKPLISGDFLGSVTLYDINDKRGKYIWYTVLVRTKLSKKRDTMSLSCQVRKQLAFDVELENPLREVANVQVRIHGEGLSGPSIFEIKPGHTGVYTLEFSPLRAFKGVGSVFFMHEQLGEIWYEFNLCGEEVPVERLEVFKAELGKIAKFPVFLENPTFQEAKFTYRITNPQNFDVIAPSNVIPPQMRLCVELAYIPSDLDKTEQGEIFFESPEIGSWTFLVFGTGQPPTIFEEKEIWGSLNKDFSSVLKFKNPFKNSISVDIEMIKDPADGNVFELLLKKNKVTVGPLATAELPFSFTPREIRDYHTEVVVTMNEKISWRYPIRGITESVTSEIYKSIKTKARGEKYEDDFFFELPGVVNISPEEEYDVTITCQPSQYENVVRKWFVLEPRKNQISNENEKLEYHLNFSPMKPFKATADIALSKASGGRWRYKVNLESTPPEEDDVISIFSKLNQTKSVKFQLFNNYIKNASKFTATFSHDSAPEFSVHPKSGELKLQDRFEGTEFTVSFTPVEYGKVKEGKLIIQTDDMYWSFKIKGGFEQWVKPTGIMGLSRIRENPPPPLTNGKPSKKRFLIENMKNSKVSNKSKSRSKSRSRSPPQLPKLK